MKTVTKAFLRYLLRRRSLSLLQTVGIACGVAAVVGMVFSARAAFVSFSTAIQFLNGSATHLMEHVAGPIDERLLTRLMHDPSVRSFSPAIDRRVRLKSGEPVRLLGIDPFLDRAIRPHMVQSITAGAGNLREDNRRTLRAFLLDEQACLMDEKSATRLKFAPGAFIETSRGVLRLVATFPTPSPEPLIVVDIGHAQRLFSLRGRVDRIDLVLKDESPFLSRFHRGYRIQSIRQKERMYEAMLEAFRLNLEALSLIALFVGVFLIYNTTMFTVVSRRRDAGILRSLGASRAEVVSAFLTEILIFGIGGGVLGGLFGYALSRSLTGLVGQTISNLYFFLKPAPLPWSWWLVAAGVFFGCSAGLLGGVFPLFDLVRLDAVSTIQGRALIKRDIKGTKRVAWMGVVMLALTAGLLGFSRFHVYVGFVAAFAFLFAASLLTGLVLVLISPALKGILAFFGGLAGRMAAGNIRQNLNRTAVATAAFMVALSMSVGLGSMIGSFRESLVWWMDTQLRADVYVGSASEGFEVPERFFEELKAMHGLGGIDPYRNVQMTYEGRPISVAAVCAEVLQEYTRFGWLEGGNENWDHVKGGDVVVSESLARNFKKARGDTIVLDGRGGPVRFRIAGVFYDYTTEHGLVMMDRSVYLAAFGDHTINSVGIFIDPRNPARERLLDEVRKRAFALNLPVFTLGQIHANILSVFDSTFAVTRSMRMLAIIVAFFGITGALLTLFMERQREFGIYRALGFSTRQVATMTFMEGLGMGMVSFILSIAVGTVLAIILIKVINLRSFNWTIFYFPSAGPYVLAGVTAVLASAGAALYPIWRILRTYPHMQLREE
jgi:putative ABC transport system permease protein